MGGSKASECCVSTCTSQRAVSGVRYDDVDQIKAGLDAERDAHARTPVTMAELPNPTTLADVPKCAAIADESQHSRTMTIESASHHKDDKYSRHSAALHRDEDDSSFSQRRSQ